MDARARALVILHLRDLMMAAWLAAATGDVFAYRIARDDFAHHVLRDLPTWFRDPAVLDRYVADPARRMWVRMVNHDATVTVMHPGDARDAPERDVPAEVRVFPQRDGRRP